MSNSVDKQYLNLIQDILDNGIEKEDRTGVGTLSVFGRTMRFNMNDGFPLITTKRVWYHGVLHELLWFLSGNTNIKYLVDNDVHIWDEWADENGDLGPIYGAQWTSWETKDANCYIHNGSKITPIFNKINQIQQAIDTLKTNPDSRRIIVSAWNVANLPIANHSLNEKMALPPCHHSFQFYSHEEDRQRYLSLLFNMRSSDVFLGLPFNIASYATLLHMVAHVTDHKPHELIFSGCDVHLYKNHIEQAKEQLTREPYKLPVLKLNQDIDNIFNFKYEDFIVEDYKCHKTIKAPIAI